MKINFLKGDAEFTMQVLIMAIFGVAVALVLFVMFSGNAGDGGTGAQKPTTTAQPAVVVSSFGFEGFVAAILASFILTFIRKKWVVA